MLDSVMYSMSQVSSRRGERGLVEPGFVLQLAGEAYLEH